MAKVFISHSSADKELVDLFKNIILNAGLGIADKDIAYTSAVETGVPTGGNIPQYIKDNLAECDFVFFMISDNYRKSEVCLNEMGAAWALNKYVRPILLYDVPFTSVGWLYSMNLCAKIDDSERLDALRDEFLGRYTNIPQTSVWNRNKKEFIYRLHNKKYSLRKKNNVKIYNTAQNEHIGILDCIELFGQNKQEVVHLIKIIHAATDSLILELQTVSIDKNHFEHLLSSNNGLLRRCVNEYAKCMNKISNVIETNGNLLKENISSAIEMAELTKHKNKFTEDMRIGILTMFLEMQQCQFPIYEIADIINDSPDIEETQIKARDRLVDNCNNIINDFENWIDKFNKITNDKLCLH